MNVVGTASPERERSKAARKVVPVRQFRVAEFGRNVVVQRSVRFLRSSVRHVAEDPRAGTSSEEGSGSSSQDVVRALLRVKDGVSSDQGGKTHGIDVRCETALSLNRKGSLRKRRCGTPTSTEGRHLGPSQGAPFHEVRWKRSRSSPAKERRVRVTGCSW